jgi:signal transduction histidine kinase/ActR/RegA family two-component response regulator
MCSSIVCAANTRINSEQRHPLEVQALTEPEKVLEKLPAARALVSATNHHELAKLSLAEANACRVIADWLCQRRAGLSALAEADQTTSVYLQVRSRVVLGRAHSSLGDFNAAARALAQAQQRLGDHKDTQLFPDIMLAYSSTSFRLGQLEESYRYAREALPYAPAASEAEMRVRLLRNVSRAASELGRPTEARDYLRQASDLLPAINDPKLTAEILLERARTARTLKDAETVALMGQKITALAVKLQNSQLAGLGMETSAQGLQMRGQPAQAIALFEKASQAYAALNLYRDEMRVVRAKVDLQLSASESNDLNKSIARLNQLNDKVTQVERDAAAADFEERLAYAQADAKLATANAKAEAEHLRAGYNENKFRYTLLAISLASILLLVVFAMYLLQQRYAQRIRERNKEMEQVLIQTSHDMRNPLSGILGMSDWLLSTHLPDDQKNKVQAIRDAGASLHALAQDLLDRGRIKGGKLGLHLRTTDLKHLIHSLGILYQPLANKKNLDLQVQFDEKLPKFVSIDSHRLQQVLGNLLGNALKFTDQGRISLEVFDSGTELKKNMAVIRFQVRDSGAGIAKGDQERLFQAFEKGDISRKNVTGAGLGLAISKDLVRLMGGKLDVLSAPGEGASFFFTLSMPITQAPIASEQDGKVSDNVDQIQAEALTILAVDDEAISRLILSHQITALGHHVQLSETPSEALISAGLSRFDVVILDYEMADMKGPELATKLRALYPNASEIPHFIMLSGHTRNYVSDHQIVDDWLVKPVNLKQLRHALDKRNWHKNISAGA